MAFSATVRHTAYMGEGIKVTVGDWSGAAGDAAGTITIGGPYIIGYGFYKFDGDNTSQIFPRVDVTTSGFTATLTIQNQDNVVTGRFFVLSIGQ